MTGRHLKLVQVLADVREVLLAAARVHDQVHLRGRHLRGASVLGAKKLPGGQDLRLALVATRL